MLAATAFPCEGVNAWVANRMVGIQHAQMFIVIGRRHVYEQSRFTIEIEPHDLPVFQTVRVKLTNANTGDFLYEGEFRVTLDPLGIVAED